MAAKPKRQKSNLTIDSTRTRERHFWKQGISFVAGVDEAGIGPLAGPVVAAAVVLPPGFPTQEVNDSKKLSHKTREAHFGAIQQAAVSWSIAEVDHVEIDQMNIYHAGLEAMRRAVAGLSIQPGHVLVDGRTIPDLSCAQTRIVGGDACEAAIAAASILAKVHRDRIMMALDQTFPGYGFAGHKGYPTPVHKEALQRLGASPVHRMSYPAVQELCGTFSPLFHEFLEKSQALETPTEIDAWRKDIRHAGNTLTEMEKKRLRAVMTRQQAKRR